MGRSCPEISLLSSRDGVTSHLHVLNTLVNVQMGLDSNPTIFTRTRAVFGFTGALGAQFEFGFHKIRAFGLPVFFIKS